MSHKKIVWEDSGRGYEFLKEKVINEVRKRPTKTTFDIIRALEIFPVIAIATAIAELVQVGILSCDQDNYVTYSHL